MIILRMPQGWTRPKEVDGLKTEGTWRSHQVLLANLQKEPKHADAGSTVGERKFTHRRTNHGNLHVRGYKEEGTTTAPFDMPEIRDWKWGGGKTQ